LSTDYQSKSRAAGYFNNLLLNDPQKLLKLYALGVADDIEDNRGTTAGNVALNGKNHSWNKVSGGKRIAYVNLTKKPRLSHNKSVNGSVYAGNAFDTVVVGGQFNENPAWVPVYFLPWIKDADGGVVNLHIPDIALQAQVANSEGKQIPNPGIFFTASISGCSIFFKNTNREPRVYHAGGSTGHVNNPANAALHWQTVMNDPKGTAKGVVQAEVDKTHYIDDGVTAGGPAGSTTARAGAYETWLQNKYTNRLHVEYVQPWGSVIGFRDAAIGTWTFYLQENATIFYVEYKKILGIKTKQLVTSGMKYASRPLRVTQIFPGNGHAWIPNQQPKLKFA
jgi:hypothetical protein